MLGTKPVARIRIPRKALPKPKGCENCGEVCTEVYTFTHSNNGDTDVDVVSAGRLVIDAAAGIGSADVLETTVGSVDLDNSTSGNIGINESDALTVVRAVIAAGDGTLNIQTVDGDLTTTGSVSTTGAGTIDLLAGDSGSSDDDDLSIQGTVVTGTGKITLTSDRNDVTFTAG